MLHLRTILPRTLKLNNLKKMVENSFEKELKKELSKNKVLDVTKTKGLPEKIKMKKINTNEFKNHLKKTKYREISNNHKYSFKSIGEESKKHGFKSKYCKRKGLILHQFTYWQKKFEQEIEKSNNEKWLSIFDDSLHEEKKPDNEHPHCEIEFGNGTKLVFKNKSSLSILKTIIPLVKC